MGNDDSFLGPLQIRFRIELMDRFTTVRHLAAPIGIDQLAGRLQPVAAATFDHGTEHVMERGAGTRAANHRCQIDDRVADGSKGSVPRRVEVKVMQMLAVLCDFGELGLRLAW